MDLILVGDEAYTVEEWEALQRERDAARAYRSRPDVRARVRAYFAAWREAHREERRAYNREWMRRYRSEQRRG